MKRLLILALLCAVPTVTFSHPGKTDRHGGHKCIKGCEEWGLYYTEYHLHDKYGKPIRIGSKMNAAKPSVVQSTVTETIVTQAPVTVATQTITVYRNVTIVQEEDVIASNPLLWVVLVLLLLLLIFLRNRKREEV